METLNTLNLFRLHTHVIDEDATELPFTKTGSRRQFINAHLRIFSHEIKHINQRLEIRRALRLNKLSEDKVLNHPYTLLRRLSLKNPHLKHLELRTLQILKVHVIVRELTTRNACNHLSSVRHEEHRYHLQVLRSVNANRFIVRPYY